MYKHVDVATSTPDNYLEMYNTYFDGEHIL